MSALRAAPDASVFGILLNGTLVWLAILRYCLAISSKCQYPADFGALRLVRETSNADRYMRLIIDGSDVAYISLVSWERWSCTACDALSQNLSMDPERKYHCLGEAPDA